jgi:hypothetical protein
VAGGTEQARHLAGHAREAAMQVSDAKDRAVVLADVRPSPSAPGRVGYL